MKINQIGTQVLSNAIETPIKVIQDQKVPIDVLIIGSGTAGVTTAIALAEKNLGLRIVILEAGPLTILEHIGSSSLRFNARAVHGIQNQIVYKTAWITENEYLETQQGKTLSKVNTQGWSAVGGRTLLWGGFSPRFLPNDFENWPFTYKEFEPYYEQAENLISVSSRPPEIPAFIRNSEQENFIVKLIKIGFSVQESPLAIDTSLPVNGNIPKGYDSAVGRLLGSKHLVTFGHHHPGISLVSQAEVVSLEKKSEHINAVHVIDKRTDTRYTFAPKQVVIAGGGVQSVRLVMLSQIEDNHEILGHYINDHLFARGFIKLKKKVELNSLMHLFSPPTKEKLFHSQFCGPLTEKGVESFIKDWTALPTSWLNWKGPGNCFQFHLFGIGTMEKNNRMILNHQHDPLHGKLPGYTIIYDRSEKDLATIREMRSSVDQLAKTIEGEIFHWELLPPGSALHDICGLRMGTDPNTSIVNPSGRFWRIHNLSVADASAWPSQGSANPYLTITAWALKVADDLAKRLFEG
jgi:glucose dehydrogenase